VTRLTNAFSKMRENYEYSLAICFLYDNFCRVRVTLKTTPAVAAGNADKVWSVERASGCLGRSPVILTAIASTIIRANNPSPVSPYRLHLCAITCGGAAFFVPSKNLPITQC
jgi:hypothetical protein